MPEPWALVRAGETAPARRASAESGSILRPDRVGRYWSAAQLGISARTVQRRLADLMEATGVLTRLQLAAEAVRRGWV